MRNTKLRQTRKEKGLLDIKEAAEILEVTKYWLTFNRDKFPRKHLLGRRWYYHEDDLAAIKYYIDSPRLTPTERLRNEGLLSCRTAAREYGIPEITWTFHIRKNNIARPSHRVGVCYYYKKDEAAEIAKWILGRKPPQGTIGIYKLAKLCRIAASTLRHRLKAFPDIGTLSQLGRRFFTVSDVERVKNMIKNSRQPKGMYNTSQVADMLGCSKSKLFYHVIDKNIGTKIPNCRYRFFTKQDVQLLRKITKA